MSTSSLCPPGSVLLVGGPSTGKTTFVLQLYGRLRRDLGALRLRASPDSHAHLEKAMERLNEGLEVEHTSTDVYEELRLPLKMPDGAAKDLVWPDYGGEQVKAMMDDRRISSEWESRVLSAEGWLIFLRPDRVGDPGDITHRPMEELLRSDAPRPTASVPWSDQARIIELLQLLLFARRSDLQDRVTQPTIGVVLSCWDELKIAEGRRPDDVLGERMPLLADFLAANWIPDARFCFGLSSTERPLSKTKADEDYVLYGPEKFGFVIDLEGKRSADLSLLLVELLRRSVQ